MKKTPVVPAVVVKANLAQSRVEVSFSNVGLSLDVNTADDVALAILDAVCMIQGVSTALDGRLNAMLERQRAGHPLDQKQVILRRLGKPARPKLKLIQGGRSQ